MATRCSSFAAGRCDDAPRPPQPICTKRILSPALAALRMLNGAAANTPAASADCFTNERRERLFFTKVQWFDLDCHKPCGRICTSRKTDEWRVLQLQWFDLRSLAASHAVHPRLNLV